MILVFGGAADEDGKYGKSIKAIFPETPIVFTGDTNQVKNWLPHVDAVFVHQKCGTWITTHALPPHPQVLLVVPESPSECDIRAVTLNQREANISDTFLLSVPTDVQRLKERLLSTEIQENP